MLSFWNQTKGASALVSGRPIKLLWRVHFHKEPEGKEFVWELFAGWAECGHHLLHSCCIN